MLGGESTDLMRVRRLSEALLPDSHAESRALAADLRAGGSEGMAYPSCRQPDGECVALFYPDLASNPVQGRHLDHPWDGARVDVSRSPVPFGPVRTTWMGSEAAASEMPRMQASAVGERSRLSVVTPKPATDANGPHGFGYGLPKPASRVSRVKRRWMKSNTGPETARAGAKSIRRSRDFLDRYAPVILRVSPPY